METLKDIKERLENLEDSYNDSLDEMGDVKIGTLEYQASRVLKQIDPIAYRVGFSDYSDSEIEEIESDFEEAKEEESEEIELIEEIEGLLKEYR
jgi:hypothetical protein